jgi:D-beta-D-heptose 7-phosphate kinase/D-beta-D-heptose 1-phosphate adenosyltransferase
MKPKILVVGDVMLDRYIHGLVERISPEAPIPILRKTSVEHRAGGAANVAANLASLGADTMLVGSIGADQEGDILAGLCKAIGRRWLNLNSPLGLTTVKERHVCSGQQLLRVDQDGGRPTRHALKDIEQAVTGQLAQSKALILSDYAGGVLEDPHYMITQARSLGVPVYVDPKGTDWERYRGATLIKPNESELRAMADWGKDPKDMREIAVSVLGEYRIDSMLVTHGAGGMTLLYKDGTWHHQPAKSGPVVDVTGAGDTVLACVAYMRVINMPWFAILNRAAAGAAAVCARHGTSVVTNADLSMGLHPEPVAA